MPVIPHAVRESVLGPVFLFLVAAASPWIAAAHPRAETETAGDIRAAIDSTAHVRSCYYVTRYERTIFRPDFLWYLYHAQHRAGTAAPSQDDSARLSRSALRHTVEHWNAHAANLAMQIHYEPSQFDQLARVAKRTGTEADAGLFGTPTATARTLGLLVEWMEHDGELPRTADGFPAATPTDLRALNVDGTPALASLLATVAHDPVGSRLLSHAAATGIAIQTRNIKGVAAYLDRRHDRIVIDPTVTATFTKYNFLIHELVHAVNPRTDNSVREETLAEFIGTAVQDRISDVPMGCHPYYIFIDRVLDPVYGRLPLDNGIENDLRRAGFDIRI